ncbi:MAG: COQ9 family protein [Phenylobacterium sp.]
MSEQDDWAERTEQQVLDAAIAVAPAAGWTWRTAYQAGAAAGLSRPETELLLPRGPADLAALFSRRLDADALARLADVDPASLKIRERIRRAVEARLEAAARHESATRRWAGWCALPPNLPLSLRLGWESADTLWRWAGDTATDENHYSKRAILSGILIPALAVRLSGGHADAMAYVDARIENVMAFEKWKAGIKPSTRLHALARSLGRMRYG